MKQYPSNHFASKICQSIHSVNENKFPGRTCLTANSYRSLDTLRVDQFLGDRYHTMNHATAIAGSCVTFDLEQLKWQPKSCKNVTQRSCSLMFLFFNVIITKRSCCSKFHSLNVIITKYSSWNVL